MSDFYNLPMSVVRLSNSRLGDIVGENIPLLVLYLKVHNCRSAVSPCDDREPRKESQSFPGLRHVAGRSARCRRARCQSDPEVERLTRTL